MKENVAPEKLYFTSNEKGTHYYTEGIPFERKYVEYTRTDDFIERALAYLHDKFYFNNEFYGIVSTDFNAMEELCKDFEKYMKGE